MGLTHNSTGNNILEQNNFEKVIGCDFTIGLAGNPNVGKSTIFNALTGLNQHTGNWTGKTVSNAMGTRTINDKNFLFVDLPGTYSLFSNSEEEKVAKDYIESNHSDVILIVVDATTLERNLNLVYQILDITPNVVICVNLLDEAKKKGIEIDLNKLSELLGVPVVGTIARKKKTLNNLMGTIYDVCTGKITCRPIKVDYSLTQNRIEPNYEKINKSCTTNNKNSTNRNINEDETIITEILNKAKEVSNTVCTYSKKDHNKRTRTIDKILTSKTFGIPIMLLFLGIIFWLTIIGANYPSQLLSDFFGFIQDKLYILFDMLHSPTWLTSLLIDGVYRTLAWVVSVMLPPMAIFFPLFTLLEDLGYLPRIAFNLDKCFKKCCASRKASFNNVYGLWL